MTLADAISRLNPAVIKTRSGTSSSVEQIVERLTSLVQEVLKAEKLISSGEWGRSGRDGYHIETASDRRSTEIIARVAELLGDTGTYKPELRKIESDLQGKICSITEYGVLPKGRPIADEDGYSWVPAIAVLTNLDQKHQLVINQALELKAGESATSLVFRRLPKE